MWSKVAEEVNMPDMLPFTKLDFITDEPYGLIPNNFPEILIYQGSKDVKIFDREKKKEPTAAEMIKWALDAIDEHKGEDKDM